MSQDAVVKQRKSIYIVWIIPFVAMVIAGWMIFKYYDNKGYDIVVTFNDADGLAIGKTHLIYQGIKIGVVSDLKIHHGDLAKVDATITVDKRAPAIAKQGNMFWKVVPRVSLTEVTGLSTILSGAYISVMPSVKDIDSIRSLPAQKVFTALNEAPADIFVSGLRISLDADESDIQVGAPIMFRKINVGKVEEVKLTKEGVRYAIYIQEKYSHLVKENSSFWKISGVEVRASLAGLRVSMDSLASVVAGGIALNSPEDGKVVSSEDNLNYKLYNAQNEAYLDNDIITLVSKNGYNIDDKLAHVYFKGNQAGDIVDVVYDPSKGESTFKIKLGKHFRHLANKDAYFWIVEPHIGLMSIKGLDAIARGPYITFETRTKSKKMQDNFTLHTQSPLIEGVNIRLLADNGFNLQSGVNIVYHDIVIGMIKRSYISKSAQKVVFDIVIANKYKHLVNDSSSFYIQGALEGEVSLEGMYLNIGSLTSMVHSGIVLVTTDIKAKATRKSFDLLEDRRVYEEKAYVQDGGVFIKLKTKKLGSITKGAPVLYNGVPVGKVIGYKLDAVSGDIDINIYIQGKYKNMINASTNFFNISGVEIEAAVSGVKVVTGSLQSIIQGGIAFKTPLKKEKSQLPKTFTLFEDEEKADAKYLSLRFTTQQKTELRVGSNIVYKTIPVGEITTVKLVEDKLVYEALLDEAYSYLLADDSKFWVEGLVIDIDQIKNPSALITGAFVEVMKGSSIHKSDTFMLEEVAPASTINEEGLRVLVTASKRSSLTIGSPVFYRQIKIGSIEAYSLSSDSKGVDMRLFIDPCYQYLVRENSIFYNATAIGMDVSLFGVKVSTETISTMIQGGITMVTPDEPLSKAKPMQNFKLYNEPDEDWLEYEPELLNDNAQCQVSGV